MQGGCPLLADWGVGPQPDRDTEGECDDQRTHLLTPKLGRLTQRCDQLVKLGMNVPTECVCARCLIVMEEDEAGLVSFLATFHTQT